MGVAAACGQRRPRDEHLGHLTPGDAIIVPVTRAAAELLQEAVELDEADRIDRAAELLATANGPADADWEEAWGAELDRRTAEADRTGNAGDTWEEVRAHVLSRARGA